MTTTITHNSPVTKAAVDAGDTTEPIYTPAECVISVVPGGGGTMLAQATWSLRSEVEAGAATWHDWDEGTVSAKATQLLLRATAVRFTATTAAGVGEVAR